MPLSLQKFLSAPIRKYPYCTGDKVVDFRLPSFSEHVSAHFSINIVIYINSSYKIQSKDHIAFFIRIYFIYLQLYAY